MSSKNKWDECKDCIYFQEVQEAILSKNNSAYDAVIEMQEFVKNCNICKEINKC